MVRPAVLAMDELTHDKAPVRMHEVRGALARPSPTSLGDGSDVISIDTKATNPLPANKGLVIEGVKRRVGDDDPTMLMVREELKAKGEPTSRGVGAGSRAPASGKEATPSGKSGAREV